MQRLGEYYLRAYEGSVSLRNQREYHEEERKIAKEVTPRSEAPSIDIT